MNTYTIQQICTMFEIPASTLRYYEEIGLLPNVQRTKNNQRIYSDEHIARLNAINCFKRTGLPINKMLEFFEYEKNLPEHINDIIRLVSDHEKYITEEIEKLQHDLIHIKHKVRFYNKIKEAYENNTPLPCFDEV